MFRITFEEKLSSLGYKLIEEDVKYFCSHPTNFYIYIQSPYEYMDDEMKDLPQYNKNIYLDWYMRVVCEECCKNMLCNLDCSGLYSNVKIFKEDMDVTLEFWGNIISIDPEEEIYEEEVEF